MLRAFPVDARSRLGQAAARVRGEHLRNKTDYNARLAADLRTPSAVDCNPLLGNDCTTKCFLLLDKLAVNSLNKSSPVWLRSFRKQPSNFVLHRHKHTASPFIISETTLPRACHLHTVYFPVAPIRMYRTYQSLLIKANHQLDFGARGTGLCVIQGFPSHSLTRQKSGGVPCPLGKETHQFTSRQL